MSARARVYAEYEKQKYIELIVVVGLLVLLVVAVMATELLDNVFRRYNASDISLVHMCCSVDARSLQ